MSFYRDADITCPGVDGGSVAHGYWQMEEPPPDNGKLVWDGKKVVGLSEYNFGVARAGSWSSRRLFMICVNTAGISAILAIACYRAWRRQQRMC